MKSPTSDCSLLWCLNLPDARRQPLLTLLNDYVHRFGTESDMVHRYIEFVEQHEDCFERSQLSGHVTGSALVLDSAGERLLLTHHRKLDRWLQPGGHADGDSDIHRVAMTEAEEESGLASIRFVSRDLLDVDIHRIPVRKQEPEHFHYDCRFLLQSTGPDEFTVSEESHDLAWVAISDIHHFTTEESILRMIDKVPLFQAS